MDKETVKEILAKHGINNAELVNELISAFNNAAQPAEWSQNDTDSFQKNLDKLSK